MALGAVTIENTHHSSWNENAGLQDRGVRILAVVAFLGGLLLAVRTMFFGVQRRLDENHLAHRVWPLGLGAFLVISGALVYVRATAGQVTILWISSVALIGVAIAGSTWWFVRRSATTPSNDPEDDPRYRFQGHVARITEPIEPRVDSATGRIAFIFDGKPYEFRARWSPGDWQGSRDEKNQRRSLGGRESEVVIERVEDEVAYVEPWAVVEERL